jgi:uncharacterized protein YbbC (DUF1343 family)
MAANLRLRGLATPIAILSLLVGLAGCSSAPPSAAPPAKVATENRPAPAVVPPPSLPPAPPVRIFPVMLGIDVLESDGFAAVRGKRIGLLTHAAGVNRRGESTIDVLRHAPGVKLVALFAPEHGLYGTEEAGKNLPDGVDARTGLPIYSLHGKIRRPTKAMLKGLDALVIDLQDIGVRSYTYVSAMRYALEGCFENHVEVIVLDRPNPLGGLTVNGPPMDADLLSYVGAFRVPYVHGLTIGELARLAVATPGTLAVPETVRLKGRLVVVPMRGWHRSMRWPDTGLKFVGTSPYVQDFPACVGYAMGGLGCEIGGFTHGSGSLHPFIAFRGKTSEQLLKELDALRLPGLVFHKATLLDANKKPSAGVQVEVTNWAAWQPTDLSFHMMRLSCKWSGTNPFAKASAEKVSLFRKLVGSDDWWSALIRDGARVNVESYLANWRQRAQIYQQQVRRYWLYLE